MSKLCLRRIKIHQITPVLTVDEVKDISFIENMIKNLEQHKNHNIISFRFDNLNILHYDLDTYECDIHWVHVHHTFNDNTDIGSKYIKEIFSYYLNKILIGKQINL
jgi:hypothetical protein